MKLGLIVFAAWLGAAPGFAEEREESILGRVSDRLFDQITGMFSGSLPEGVTPQLANGVLLSLIREEHAAANPGPDSPGLIDTVEAFDELSTAFANVKEATAAEMPMMVGTLKDKIDAFGALWKRVDRQQGQQR